MTTRSGWFALAMGVLMIIVWAVLIATGQHDFQTASYESSSLLAAETLTAFGLVVGGLGLLSHRPWAAAIHLASLGMMLYTSVNSIGVFSQAGVIPAALFFLVLTLISLALVAVWARRLSW